MKQLTHKDVLDYLKEKGILYKEIENENADGELEITGIEFNTIRGIIRDLHERQSSLNSLIKDLKEKIRSDDGGVYFEKQVLLNNQTINFQKDCYFLDCNYMTISGCYFINRRKKIGSKPVITIVSQKTET